MTTSDVLDLERCRHLLRTHELGRLAIRRDDTVDIFPINYLVHDDELFFRSAPGSKLMELAQNPGVAFEIDGRSGRRLWSVVVHGVARRLNDDEEIERSGIRNFQAAHDGEKFNYVAIGTDEVSGREFVGTPRRWNAGAILLVGALVVALIAIGGIVGQLLGR
jgi:nitroimidazol reductase NimA-like FMN-containing flavoprotein (pyridoxamine 5'-phosphate oxidase superfamily)